MSSNVGTFTITPFGATAPATYLVGYVPGTLTISPAALLLTANGATRIYGAVNPAFSATFGGFVNGDNTAVVSGLTFTTPATTTSAVGDYAITPLGATAANYTFAYVNGTLHVMPSTVVVVTTPTPVTTISQQPLLTPELAVILQGDRLVLIPVNPQGDVSNEAGSASASLDGQLTVGLSEVTSLPRLASATNSPGVASGGGATSPGQPNSGGFEIIASLGGGGGGASPGGISGLTSAQMSEPGLFRESTVNMGGFKVIYHEPLAEARQQAESNTAQGSSYREFLDSENPQVNLVRAKIDRKPADPAGGRNPSGTL
jgi:hypothetical protein